MNINEKTKEIFDLMRDLDEVDTGIVIIHVVATYLLALSCFDKSNAQEGAEALFGDIIDYIDDFEFMN